LPKPTADRATPRPIRLNKQADMTEGTIKRLTDKGFGFIDTGDGKDMFFHMSSVIETTYDDLREGQKVTFDVGEGPKGPRAENVKLAE
jgi:cold shock protein